MLIARGGHLNILLVPIKVMHAVILTPVGEVGVRTLISISKSGKHNHHRSLLFGTLK